MKRASIMLLLVLLVQHRGAAGQGASPSTIFLEAENFTAARGTPSAGCWQPKGESLG